MNKRILSLLGLAARARKIITGEELVIKEIRQNAIRLVLLAEDAAEGTKKKVTNKCSYYKVPIRIVGNRQELGQAIGKGERVVIGVIDQGFANKLISLMDE